MSADQHALTALSALLRFTLVLSLLLLLVMALRPLLRRRYGAACAYAAWLLLPAMLTVSLLPASPAGQAVQQFVATSGGAPALRPSASAVLASQAVLPSALLTVYLLGITSIALTLAVRQRRFMRGLRRDGALWRSPRGGSPALVGLWPARLCLPEDFEQRFAPAERALILAHEAVHRRRHDNAWNLVALALAALQWFNPLAWLGLRLMRADQELSCDAAVLRREPAEVFRYAQALLAAQHGAHATGLPWSSWQSRHPLVERIAMLKHHSQARRSAGLRTVALLALLGAGGVHALAPEEPKASAGAKPQVRLEFDLQVIETGADKSTTTRRTQPWMAGLFDRKMSLRMGMAGAADAQAAPQLEIAVTPSDLGERGLQIELEVRHGEPWQTVAKPRLIVADGEAGRIEAKLGEGRRLVLSVTPRRLPG